MHLSFLLTTIPLFFLPCIASTASHYLTLTAVTSDSSSHAVLECWCFLTPFSTYPTTGISLSLANTTNITYVVLPPKSAEGLHKPPHSMFFVLLSGLAHVTFPFNDEELWIHGGTEGGLIVANDVEGIGHFTEYPGEEESVALQLPFRDGIVPDHEVVGRGACPKNIQGDESEKPGSEGEKQQVLGTVGRG
jgi:hypothetical protein